MCNLLHIQHFCSDFRVLFGGSTLDSLQSFLRTYKYLQMVEKHKFFWTITVSNFHTHLFLLPRSFFFFIFSKNFDQPTCSLLYRYFSRAANIKWSTLKVEIINTKKIMMQNISKVNKQKNLKRDVFFLPHQQQHSMCVHIENTTYSTQYVCMQYYPEIQFPVFKKQAKSKQIFTAELQHFFSRVQKQLLMFVLWFSKVDDEGQVHHFHFTLSFSVLCSRQKQQ